MGRIFLIAFRNIFAHTRRSGILGAAIAASRIPPIAAMQSKE